MTASGLFSFFIFNTYVRWLWGVNKTFFIRVRLTCFWIGSSLFWLRHSLFRVRPSHFSSQSFSLFQSVLPTARSQFFSFLESVLPTFRCQSFSFFDSDLLIFTGQSFPLFEVSISHFSSQTFPFFESVLPILFSKLLFNYFESILQFMGLVRRCLTWDINRKYIFQWKNWFGGDKNKFFLCRVYVHWNLRIFKCVPWTPN